ncbi:sortase [Candidatus Saccharibacteria bacterium]|nr:sortase [Candidatus Saccharibacteria bacterium]
MEIRARLDFRKIVILLYAVCFVVYLIFGLTPTSAGATYYEISGNLEIPAIDLNSDVTTLNIEDHQLKTPRTIVGSYSQSENKTLLIGHSSTVFSKLDQIWVGDIVNYNGYSYLVKDIIIDKKENISMRELLRAAETDTLIIMTCAGNDLEDGDATHRLIITAEIMSSLDE